MDVSSIALAAIASSQSQTRAAIATEVLKQQHQADQALVNMIEQVAKSAPPPTSSGRVDLSV